MHNVSFILKIKRKLNKLFVCHGTVRAFLLKICESFDTTQRKRPQVVHFNVPRVWSKTNSPQYCIGHPLLRTIFTPSTLARA